MSLLLREDSILWGPYRLKNNDVTFEVVTPAADLEVKVYNTQREFDAAERAFRNKTETSWDAFIWFVDPDHKTDKSYLDAAKSYFHIHMFATLLYGQGLRIDKLLPKSGHDKGEFRVNLADRPLAEWDALVANMSIRTKLAVERFRVNFVEFYLVRG